MIRTSPVLVLPRAGDGRCRRPDRASVPPLRPPAPAAAAANDWPTYNRDHGGTRFSPLTDITPANVATLDVAWTYHMKPAVAATPAPPEAALPAGHEAPPTPGAGAPPPVPPPGQSAATSSNQTRGRRGYASSESTPARHRRHALHDHALRAGGGPRCRDRHGEVGLPSAHRQSVDARPRVLAGRRHDAGADRLRHQRRQALLDRRRDRRAQRRLRHRRRDQRSTRPRSCAACPGRNGLSSPPIVYQHFVITGGTTQENPPRGPAGDVRAWDLHTGKLAWTFRSVPQAGERFNDTWGADSWKNRSGVNVWGFFTVDTARGIVYMPFGAPSVDQYGGDRPGDNLFGTSLVAAKADTGEYLWHFQLTHHDIWDADLAAAPVLLDVTRGGKTIPAVAVVSKLGLLFVLDRATGKPIDAVEERPVPASEVPLERAAKTQPFPVATPPLSRMSMTAADVATVTPEIEAGCRALMQGVQLGGPYLPPAFNRLRVQFPGNHGGVNWGGMSYSPELGYLFVNTNELGQLSGMTPRPEGATGPAAAKGQGNRLDPGGPYEGVAGGGRFSIRKGTDPQQLPCQQPPWGQLTAIDMKTGKFAWRVPLGVTDSLPPGAAEDRPARQRRHDRHPRRPGVRRRDRRRPLPRLRRQDRQGAVDLQAAGRGAGDADDLPRQGRPAVRRDHLDRRRLLRQPGDRRQRHRVRAAEALSRDRPRAATFHSQT